MTVDAAPKSILIVRLSAIGDIVMASPLIGAFRRRYPQAHIAWLVQSESKDLLSAHPELDEVIVWPRQRWRELLRRGRLLIFWGELRALLRQLRGRRFDLAVDVQSLLKSGVWTWLSGAKRRVGLGSREGSQWLMTELIAKPQGEDRIGAEYRHLAQTLGVPTDSFEMYVGLTAEDRAFAAGLVKGHQLDSGYVVFCPFTTRAQKHWFDDYWLSLARELHSRYGWRCLVLGGPGDREHGLRLVNAAGEVLVNLAGETRLRQAAALIAGAKLVVGVDTGLMHMGSAFGVPTIALFGSTCPYLDAGRDSTVVLYDALSCSPCKRSPTCGGAFTCMRQLDVPRVLASAERLLDSL
jgi:heptosyltransferase-1